MENEGVLGGKGLMSPEPATGRAGATVAKRYRTSDRYIETGSNEMHMLQVAYLRGPVMQLEAASLPRAALSWLLRG